MIGSSSYNFNMLSDTRHQSEEEDQDDLISNLPDEIILHFLSMIPFGYALNTCVLSSKWRNLWNRTLIQYGTEEDIDCAVGDLLLHFDVLNPLRQPRILQFHFSQTLILLATIGLKKKLHLDFSKGKQEFPRKFGWQLVLNGVDPAHQPPPRVFFVQTLKLTSVSFLTKGIVSSLVSNFQSIKSLIISKCDGLRSVLIRVISKLQNLTILNCPHLKSLHAEAYELESFRFQGPACLLSLDGILYLKDAMLDFRQGPGYNHFEYHHYGPLIIAIRDVKVLTVCGWTFKAIIGPWLHSRHQNFRFSKLKHLWWIDNSMEEDDINALVSFLKFCPSLERLFINIEPSCYSLPGNMDSCSEEDNSQSRLRHLKVVKLEGFTDEETFILSEHLFKAFNVEPQIVAATPGSHSRCLKRIPRKQCKDSCKKGEQQTQKWKFTYRFVEEVEDNTGLLSKHVHMDLLSLY